ncbi:metal ABC transporter ATP-binding protein [Gulosibacter molinativorax]|uniref:ABC transporter ATP-binding protein n=1 Tax=Gulosibacter molinativorax TaxID=256821 RepID=A0ABT7CAB5_9MICO|nr:ABC transporter ATP-binding protein [Gulosibacter molinativorax]MDJ1371744.1 ABC transporter ATP-binding protein [Gulosibacter molinativorax]QUY63166.1 Manganese/zinc/iron transport system ATP-binding protein [Gulosibacter molinativorax]
MTTASTKSARTDKAEKPLAHYRDVTLSYDGHKPAATGLTLDIFRREALALVGPNASGKSTLLKSMVGLVQPIAGELEVLGKAPRQAASDIGYMPQTDEIDPEFPISLREVVTMGRFRRLGIMRWPGRTDRAAVDAALERVNLADHADTRFGDLSGGQQQRGLLARALVMEPKLLLLDEPFNGLDTSSRQMLMQTLRELRAEGVGMAVSTHDLELAHQVCSHVLLINRHQVAFGPIHETLIPEHVSETFGETHEHFDTHEDIVAHPHVVPKPEKSGL